MVRACCWRLRMIDSLDSISKFSLHFHEPPIHTSIIHSIRGVVSFSPGSMFIPKLMGWNLTLWNLPVHVWEHVNYIFQGGKMVSGNESCIWRQKQDFAARRLHLQRVASGCSQNDHTLEEREMLRVITRHVVWRHVRERWRSGIKMWCMRGLGKQIWSMGLSVNMLGIARLVVYVFHFRYLTGRTIQRFARNPMDECWC